MTFTFRRLGALVAIAALLVSPALTQDLGQQLSKLGREAAEKYTTPLLNGFGAGMNSAFYHSADLHSVLGFDVGIKLAIVSVEDADKTYSLDLPPSITVNSITFTRGTGPTQYPASITANTVVGEETETELKLNNGTATGFKLPGGLSLPFTGIPPVPQLAVGLPFGLEVVARIAPSLKMGEAGKYSVSGFGLRYDVDQWLPLFPVDIAVHFASQKVTFKDGSDKDVFTASGSAYGVEVSKGLLFLTVYGGFQLESSTMSVASFTGTDAASGNSFVVQGFDVEGRNKSRITVGARLLLLFINVHAEYAIAENNVLAAGVGITFR